LICSSQAPITLSIRQQCKFVHFYNGSGMSPAFFEKRLTDSLAPEFWTRTASPAARRNSTVHSSRKLAAASKASVVDQNCRERSGRGREGEDRKRSGKAGVTADRSPDSNLWLSFVFSAIDRNCPTAFLSRLLMNALGDLAATIAGGYNRCGRATAV
jgi:hypothetical protein